MENKIKTEIRYFENRIAISEDNIKATFNALEIALNDNSTTDSKKIDTIYSLAKDLTCYKADLEQAILNRDMCKYFLD